MLKVTDKFKGSTVSLRKGNKMIRIPKLGEATQAQLEELAKRNHPGVVKEEKTPAKGTKKEGSSSS